MNDRNYRQNLYDADGNLWGCFYPKTGTLVKRAGRVVREIDLSSFLSVDKTKTDTRQNDNSVLG
jgi:hypothetical protein